MLQRVNKPIAFLRIPELLTGFLFFLTFDAIGAESTISLPNVILILADDLGYGDVMCNNTKRCKIPTPNFDRIAREGMRFTDAHSSSGVCSPSRYTLMTGRYHWRTRLQSGIVNVYGSPLIASDRPTIASLAKKKGYRTACIGKWHLGWDWQFNMQDRQLLSPKGSANETSNKEEKISSAGAPQASKEQQAAWKRLFSKNILNGPISRGFNQYFGTDVPNWPPYCFIENDRTVGIPEEFLPQKMIGGNQASQQGPALPDWKLEKILPELTKRSVHFIDDSSRLKEPFLLYLPLTSPHTPLAVNKDWINRSGLNPYADFVMETDACVGKILEALDKNGLSESTLVIFTSDNGCAPYAGVKELEKQGHYPSGPLRGYKADAWEGGHRVPFLVRWPGLVGAGSICDQLVHHADIFQTLADIWELKVAENSGEDSFSLLPVLKGGKTTVRTNAISTSIQGVPGVRMGSWKYIPAPGSGGWAPGMDPTQSVQLYNLVEDLGETRNLAFSMADKVSEMQVLLERLITEGRSTPGARQKNDVEVIRYPRPNPGKKPAQKSEK